jgi:hypothetical protein
MSVRSDMPNGITFCQQKSRQLDGFLLCWQRTRFKRRAVSIVQF